MTYVGRGVRFRTQRKATQRKRSSKCVSTTKPARTFAVGSRMSHPIDTITNTVAVASLAVPLWLPSLQETSQFAALIIPILGAAWLILQIAMKIHAFYKGRNH